MLKFPGIRKSPSKPGNFSMKTPYQANPAQDLFREELLQIIDQKHPLFALSHQINWSKAEEIVLSWFDERGGRPGKNARLVAGLFLLKQMKNVSDENLPELWVENPYWQYFCGEKYFQHEFPIHPSAMSKWRKKMKESDAEKLLMLTIDLGLKTEIITERDMNCVNVDTTVQEKAITYPTDSKLYVKAICKLGKLSKKVGLGIKQNYKFVSKNLLFKACNYRRANQIKRAKKVESKLKTNLGRLIRDIERQLVFRPELALNFLEILEQSKHLLSRKKESKNKLYSLHAPEVECIAKGKAKKRYEFGVKVSVVATQKKNFILGSQALPGNPYDGHTLKEALDQVEKMCGRRPKHGFVDNGYKKHSEEVTDIHVARKKSTYATRSLKARMKKRNAIEACIGHSKRDGQLGKNYLKGSHGDKLNALLSAVGHNLRMVYQAIWIFIFIIYLASLNEGKRFYDNLLNLGNLEINPI